MPRPIWKGFVSFGLVMIPTAMSSLEEPAAEVGFTMLDKRDNSRIRYQRVNEHSGREVEWKDIVKGYQIRPNRYVVVTPADLKRAAPKATKSIEITDFVDRAQISPKYFEKPYLLTPQPGGEKGYALLTAALRTENRVGLAKIVLHTRQHLAALLAEDDVLVLNTMRFQDELRTPEEFDMPEAGGKAANVSKRELDMAKVLIDGMTVDFKPEKYHDEYREALKSWLERMAKEGKEAEPVEVEEEPEVEGPYNIMDLLKKSVEERGGAGHRSRSHAGGNGRHRATHTRARTAHPRRKAG